MIPLVKENPDEFPEAEEHCCFCYQITPYWYAKKDVAVCPTCAKTHKVEEVPTKEQWCLDIREKIMNE